MDTFNRWLVVVVDLSLVAAAVIVLLITLGLVSPAALVPTPWLAARLAGLTDLAPATQEWTLATCLVLLVLGFLLLYYELRPAAPRVMVKQDAMGTVTVARDSIRELVSRESGRVPGVMEVSARVREDRHGLRILERVSIDPGASVLEVTEELQRRVKVAVEHHLGRPVAEVSVATQVAPLSNRRPSAARVR